MVLFSKFLTGQRNSKLLLDNEGYTYTSRKDKDTALVTAWRCSKNRSLKCLCIVYLAQDNSLSLGPKPHNHESEINLVEKRDLLTNLKRKAADQPLSATQNLVVEVLATASTSTNIVLPKLESLNKVVQRARAKASGSSCHVESRKALEFILPPTCLLNQRKEPFVLFNGTTPSNSRLIIFTCARNLRVLAMYTDWITDGTFNASPFIFVQSYSIHAVIQGKCIPLVFALLCNKDLSTYVFMLEKIQEQLQLTTGSVMLDFEKSAMNAFGKVLPQFAVRNCFFHLCQSVQKRISLHFKVRYAKDKDFARASRLVVFLAFVPLDRVEDAFEALSYYIAEKYPELMVVVNYFEKTYLGLLDNIAESDVRGKHQFPVKFWNHFAQILLDPEFPRTSNMVEGFHRGFNSRLIRPKGTVQEYHKAITAQQVQTDFHLDRLLNAGITPSKKRKTSNQELYEICKSFGSYSSILDYLFQVAEYFGHPDPTVG